MSFGALLGALTLYNTWRHPSPSQARVLTTAVFGGLYWVAGMTGILYPDTKAQDPEFGDSKSQLYAFAFILGVDGLGWWLESSRLAGLGLTN